MQCSTGEQHVSFNVASDELLCVGCVHLEDSRDAKESTFKKLQTQDSGAVSGCGFICLASQCAVNPNPA